MSEPRDPRRYTPGLDSPASGGDALTANDTTVFNPPYRWLYVGAGGHVHVLTSDGDDLTFRNVPSGGVVWAFVKKLFVDSTASDIIGMR